MNWKMAIRQWAVNWGIPVILYGLMATLLISPAYIGTEQRIIGGGELGGWLWRYWWMKLEIVALGLEFPSDPLARFFYMVSLGRFPETGNITDLYAVSVPLDLLWGHPDYYNVKVFLILFTNAFAAYAYLLHLTGRRFVALSAGVTFAINVFVLLEIQQSGLRQAILCFTPLYALYLERMLSERRLVFGLASGVCYAAAAVFYWFNGLFLAFFTVARVGYHLITYRRQALSGRVIPASALAAGVALVLMLPFMWPYLSATYADAQTNALPEVTWGEDFPSPHALELKAQSRPDSRQSNLIASLARVLNSSWRIDWAFNPLQTRVVPVIMAIIAILVGVLRGRKVLFWLLLFLGFYTLTWGPFLKYDGAFVQPLENTYIRLPYWYAFKFVPMMSRLFGPYRLGAMVVFCLTVLWGLNLAMLSRRLERWPRTRFALGVLVLSLYVGQMMADPMRSLGIGSNRLLPLEASSVEVPEWYRTLAKEPGNVGIFELPHQVQQDLLAYYQTVHGKKVHGGKAGWASPGALPPILRFDKSPSKVTAFLQWLSSPDTLTGNSFAEGLHALSEMPYQLKPPDKAALEEVRKSGYRYVIVHELGCFMLEPRWGRELYVRIITQLEQALGEAELEFIEFEETGDAEDMVPFHNGVEWIPSMYSLLLIPEPRPWPMRMSVFAIPEADKLPNSGADLEEGTPGPLQFSPSSEDPHALPSNVEASSATPEDSPSPMSGTHKSDETPTPFH